MQPPYEHHECVRWSDADLQGVVNNAVYLTLFEQARFGYFRALQILEGAEFPFLLGSTSVRFERPLKAGDAVVVEARTTRLGGASFDMEYRIVRDLVQVASGSAVLVWVDGEGSSTRIPEAVRERILAFEGVDLN